MRISAAEYIEKGMEFEDMREFTEAINCYKQALKIDPRNLSAWIKIGELYSHTNNIDEAMTIFHKVLELDPTNRIALEYRRLFTEKC